MIRRVTLAWAVLFTIVVAMGWVPGWYTMEGEERLLFGLFKLSPLDDITHGITAVAAIAAGISGRRASLLFLTAFGFYYALDAIFFLTYGFVNDLPYSADIMLNLPHVLIATAMLGVVYRLAPRFDPEPAAGRMEVESARVAAPL